MTPRSHGRSSACSGARACRSSGEARGRGALLALCAALLAFLVASCTSWTPLPATEREPAVPFALGPGDRVKVEVWGQEKVTGEYDIGPDGKLALPLAGPIALRGLDLKQAAERVTEALKPYIANPSVAVVLLESKSMRVFVAGEVAKPGSVPFRDGLTLVGAIQDSGSYIDATAAKGEIHLVRGELSHPIVFRVDLDAIFDAEAQDVYVRPGDIILVPPRTVTSMSRWLGQALAPITLGAGAAAGVPK